MKLSEYHFDLPEELIAQTPLENRCDSKLLVIHKQSGLFEHKHFYDIIDYLKPGDVLVRNTSRVIPARLFGVKKGTGAKVELLILKEKQHLYECLVGNAKVVKIGTFIQFADLLEAECVGIKDEGIRLFKMHYKGIFLEVLEKLGHTPLPPYIKEQLNDKERYQNVYSKESGSAACPTAGLHFNDELLNKIQEKGVQIIDVVLHVGLGTFKPVKEEEIERHHMHHEYYEISKESASALQLAKKERRRIIAVGTTTTRVLETVIQKYGDFIEDSGETNIFIYPPYQFKAIDCQITNFHLPKSTLLMMISAFATKELIFKAYQEAINNHYRFFSFGDSMFITNE